MFPTPLNFAQIITDNDIVPAEYQDKLIMWRDVFARGSFDIGDTANELCEMSAIKGLPVTQDRVFAAVGRFVGKSARTIRYYADTAAFYPAGVRDEFHMLPFSHYVFARSQEDWRAVLEYAAEHPHFTEDALRMKFLGVQVFGEKIEIQDNGVKEFEIPPSPPGEKSSEVSHDLAARPEMALYSAIAGLSGIIEKFHALISQVSLKANTVKELTEAIDTLRKHMPEVVEAIKSRK